VVAALWLGIEAREAAAFSFLMAVPAIGGAAVLQIPETAGSSGVGLSTGLLLAGSIVAGITGVLAIRTFVAMLARRSFHLFALYCWNGTSGSSMDPVMTAIIPNYSTRPVNGGGEGPRKHSIVVDDYDAARARARGEGKLVLLNFTGYT